MKFITLKEDLISRLLSTGIPILIIMKENVIIYISLRFYSTIKTCSAK